MLKLFNRKKKDNKGFTLIELVIVVAILAILVGILAPQYTKYVEKSRKSADVSNLENLVTAFKTSASDGTDNVPVGEYTITIATDKSSISEKTDTEESKTTVGDLIAEYAGDKWTETKLKSAKWTENSDGTGDKATEISAKLIVKNDGSIDVTYTPTWVKDLASAKAK